MNTTAIVCLILMLILSTIMLILFLSVNKNYQNVLEENKDLKQLNQAEIDVQIGLRKELIDQKVENIELKQEIIDKNNEYINICNKLKDFLESNIEYCDILTPLFKALEKERVEQESEKDNEQDK